MKSILNLAIAFVALFTVGTASAANPHFNNPPTNTDNGTTLTQCGDIYGLGNNVLVTIKISSTGTVTTECTNPAGNVAPGQTKTVTTTGSGTFTSDKNGHVHYCVTTQEVTPGKCPNNKWTGEVTDVTFGPVTTTVNGRIIRGTN